MTETIDLERKPELPEADAIPPGRPPLRREADAVLRIRDFVMRELEDPDLDPGAVVAGLGMLAGVLIGSTTRGALRAATAATFNTNLVRGIAAGEEALRATQPPKGGKT